MNLEYFRLVDRIVDLDLGDRTIRAVAKVPMSGTIFEGHFPGHPLMPGVLLIETMAQTSGWMLVAHFKFRRMPFLAAVKEAKLRAFIVPGDELTITARLTHDGSGYAITEAEIASGGKVRCTSTLTFTHVAFPNEELRAHMLAVASDIGLTERAAAHG
jgi:3-hydroxyacyl-[acyl-carrier-protein] dehydratase